MIISLALKISTVQSLFDFSLVTLFPLLESAEIVMLTFFAIVKDDEDCFTCFNRIETSIQRYSIFQIKPVIVDIDEEDYSDDVSREQLDQIDKMSQESRDPV